MQVFFVENGDHGNKKLHNRRPKGHQGQTGHFEALESHRDAHNGDAPQTARQHPAQSADEPAEEEPEDVADRFHRNTSLVAVSEGDWFHLKRKL